MNTIVTAGKKDGQHATHGAHRLGEEKSGSLALEMDVGLLKILPTNAHLLGKVLGSVVEAMQSRRHDSCLGVYPMMHGCLG